MYGPKPPAARRLAHPFADGGLVARMKSADAGHAAFGSRGLSQLRDLIPKMEAMGYPQAPTASDPRAAQLQAMIPQMEAMGYKQQPQQYFADGGFVQGIKRAFGMDEERNAQIAAYRARAAAEKAQAAQQQAQQPQQPQQRAISDYSGMSATQRREKELGLADGGRVRPRGFVAGKGTETSDSIPARLSNGEYVLPADTVRAVGVEALDALRESTHKPVKGEQINAARGFFAGGTPGGVGTWFQDQEREQQQRKQAALAAGQDAESATQAAAASPTQDNTSATQAGAYAPGTRGTQLVAAPVANVQTGQPRSVSPSALYMQDRASEMREQVGAGDYAKAAGTAARTAVQGLGMYGVELADKAATPIINAARGFGSGLLGSDANATPATPSATASPPTSQTNPTDQRLAAGTQRSPLDGPVPPNQPTAASGREVVPGVYNHGRGQYSDNPNGMNMPNGFTGQPSAANNAILQRMSDQSQAQSMARVGMSQYDAEVQRAKNINADEAARNNSVGARMQRLADPFTAEGRAMRNLQMDIASSMDRNGRPTGETQALVAQSNAMTGGYLAEPGQERSIMGALQREGMQQAGANARAMLSSGIDQQRVNLASSELGLKRETQGIANRSANMIQAMQQQIATEPDATKRRGLVQHMLDVEGKHQTADPYLVVPGGQHVDPSSGKAYNTPSSVFNRQTGQWIQQPQGQDGAGKFEVGQVYRDSQTGAQRRWNGQAWEKV